MHVLTTGDYKHHLMDPLTGIPVFSAIAVAPLTGFFPKCQLRNVNSQNVNSKMSTPRMSTPKCQLPECQLQNVSSQNVNFQWRASLVPRFYSSKWNGRMVNVNQRIMETRSQWQMCVYCSSTCLLSVYTIHHLQVTVKFCE